VRGEPVPQLRLLTQHLEAIDALRDSLEAEAGSQVPLRCPTVGAACLCQFSEDNAWYRSFIVNMDGGNIKVHYVDWGNMEDVDSTRLREPLSQTLKVPAWTLLVELYRVNPTDTSSWKPETVTAMTECLFNQNVQLWARVQQSQREPPLVDLLVFEDPQKAGQQPRLAYQQLADDGLITLTQTNRRR